MIRLSLFKTLLTLIGLLLTVAAEAKQTTYYTMLSTNGRVNPRECMMEGNQIVNGQLFGSGRACQRGIPFTTKYCPWGIGNRNNCIVPCVHGAGHSSVVGQTVSIRPMVCPWGPLKGRTITQVRIADVGGAVGRGHTDVFTGVCVRKVNDDCKQYASDNLMASYGSGRGRETQIAAALVNQYYPGAGNTMLAGLNPPRATVAIAPAPAAPVIAARRPSPVTAPEIVVTTGRPTTPPRPTTRLEQHAGISSGFTFDLPGTTR